MKGWTSELLVAREIEEIKAGKFAMGRKAGRYKGHLVQQANNERIPRVEDTRTVASDSGVGCSQPTPQLEFVNNIKKSIKQMNEGRTNLVQTLKQAPSHIKELDCFKMVCDIARNAIGRHPASIASLGDTVVHLSQSLHEKEPAANNEWNDTYESILKVAEERELLDNLNEFPTFRLGVFDDEVVEEDENDRGNEATSPHDDESALPDGSNENESTPPISTPVLGSPRAASSHVLSHPANAPETALQSEAASLSKKHDAHAIFKHEEDVAA